MEHRNALVTGANGGLGVPVVRRLLDEGWTVYACLHQGRDGQQLLAAVGTGVDHLHILEGDVTVPEDVKRLCAAADSWLALVHLAGGFHSAPTFADHAPDDFDRMIALNARSAFLLFKYFLPLMKQQGSGSMVTIGARSALHPATEHAAYVASKAALIALTLQAAEEGRRHGVRANVIAPAVIRTAANAQWASSDEEQARWTPPEDIGAAIAWLISPSSAFVTGTVIPMYHHLRP